MKTILLLWRIGRRVCPGCNSTSPALDDCLVCNAYRTSIFGRPSRARTAFWLHRYYILEREHMQ